MNERANVDTKAKVRDAQGRIIDRLAQCEAAFADLYIAYGEAFPEMGGFWRALAEEERGHERLLKSLHRILDQGSIFYDLGRFDGLAIDAVLIKVSRELAALNERPLSISQVLESALSIETTLVDCRFYEVVTSDAKEFRIIAERLMRATKDHAVRVSKEMVERRSEDPEDAAGGG